MCTPSVVLAYLVWGTMSGVISASLVWPRPPSGCKGPGPPVSRSSPRGEELPHAGDSLQRAWPAVLKQEARARNQVLDGLRHENLAGAGFRRHAGTDVHGKASGFLAQLHLSRVHAGPDLHAVVAGRVADRDGAPD